MSEDNFVSRVLQQSRELVERKFKACEIYRDSTKPLSDDCYIKEPICEVDSELSRFVKEHYALQEKLVIAVKAINSAANYLVCMDDLSEINNGKCNEQMALETLNKALEQIKGKNND